jgi:Adenylate and Guanylate cyclase catalytic domain
MTESRKLAAILAADVVGFSRLAGADEERTLARLRALRSDLIDPTISVYKGRVVKRTGDGVLVEFRSVVDAVRCAIEVQNAMIDRNAGVPADRRIEFRIGIHLGDVVEESDGDLMIADAVGFGEQNPYDDRDYGTPGNPTGQGSNWRIDPLTILGAIAGGVFGVPFGGTIADFASEQLGRPLSVGLGNDVFGGDTTTDPVTGQTTPGNTTHTGGSVTVQGVGDDNDTFYGLSPSLGAIASGASNTLPSKHTYTGVNPTTGEPAPSDPFTPTTPVPSPIDTAPNSPIQVDTGNSGLSDQQLTDLFSGFMQMPQRTSRGRNAGRVIV